MVNTPPVPAVTTKPAPIVSTPDPVLAAVKPGNSDSIGDAALNAVTVAPIINEATTLVPAPVQTNSTSGIGNGGVQLSVSATTSVSSTAVGSFPPTAAAIPTALNSTQVLSESKLLEKTTTGIVPTCTIRWPDTWLKNLANPESICDAIGLPQNDAASALLRRLELFWDNGSVITYSFIGGTAGQQSKFTAMINYWNNVAYYQFVQVPQGGTLRISFDPNQGWWCYGYIIFPLLPHSLILVLVGRAALDAPSSEATVNVVLSDSYIFTQAEGPLVVHSIYHILGMMHEHPGPGNGGPVTLDEVAVYSCYQQAFGWDVQTCKSQIIDVYNSKGVSNYATVNSASVMRYPIPAALDLQNTEIDLPAVLETGIPLMDLAYLMINYPLLTPLPSPDLPLASYIALFVDADTTQAMTDALAQGNITKMRAIFHGSLLSGRLGPATPWSDPAHSSNPAPTANELGWCGVVDPSDVDDVPAPASDAAAPSGVLRGVVKNSPSLLGGLFGSKNAPKNILKELWDPYATITYGFLNPVRATEYRRRRVANVLAWYSRNTSLTFQFVDNIDTLNFGTTGFFGRRDEAVLDKCNLRIWFGEPEDRVVKKDTRTEGWAHVGQTKRYETASAEDVKLGISPWTSVYFADQAQEYDSLDPAVKRSSDNTLYHEFGQTISDFLGIVSHALGLHHEHAIKNSGIEAKPEDDLVGTPVRMFIFDEKSVMLYGGLAYKDERLDSSGQRKSTPMNPYPSPTDLNILRLLYPDTEYTFASGLSEMGFTTDETTQFLQLRDQAVKPDHRVSVNDVKKLRDELIKNLTLRPRLARNADQTRIANPSVKIETRAERVFRLGVAARPDDGTDPANVNPFEDHPVVDEDATVVFDGPKNALGPSRGVGLPLSQAPAPPVQAPGFLHELVTNLKQFFNPGGNQVFTLQFPGRFLDQASYAWDTSSAGIYGQFIKPTAVNEAEFRLVDQLYDVAPNVGGPNGTNLSIVYQQLLNNLLPIYVDNGLAQQQDQIRDWLIKDVPMTPWVADIMQRQQFREQSLAQAIANTTGTTTSTMGTKDQAPGAGVMFGIANKAGETLNRIELSELLMNEYLYAKQDWEVERDGLITQATRADVGTPEAQRALNDLTRRLAHITDTRQAQLSAKYADAVVRGYSHTIRQYMGYLDIATPAEALQDAKDSLREAAMSSLDGSMNIYPIQLTPLDWFAGLSTSFTLEDLIQNPEVIRQQIQAKSRDLDTLIAQLVALQMGGKGDPEDLKDKVQDAQTALDTAQSLLAQQFSNSVIEMAKTCLDVAGNIDIATLAGKLQVAQTALTALPPLMENVQSAQNNLTSSSRALSQLLAAQALAEASDTKQQQQQITLQIQSLTADLKELQTRWQVLTASTGGVTPPVGIDHGDQDVPTAPIALPAESSSGGSRWQEITFTSTKKSREASADSDSSAASEQWSCNLWFASASGGSSSSAATTDTSTAVTDDTIELALRAPLVTVDRGGWFQPQFFKESQTFYKVNKEITWTSATPQTMAGILKGETPVTGLMPGFPIGFIIAKDIVVRITHGASSTTDSKATDMGSSASSGGILCFSYSKSSSSNSTSTSSSFQSYSNGFVVKIPGPQILGYMIQICDPDQSKEMSATPLPANFFIPDDEYNQVVEGGGAEPQHGINPGGPNKAAEPPAPTVTQDRLREVLDKMLNEKIGEIFDEVKLASGSA
ncbi:hypothetical protein C8R45DRAFT_1084236 [Mycena sanguinolenta]|nr:hypothetical protein C8R45DRAFT_1084236 [Mycena sanguinolenta]